MRPRQARCGRTGADLGHLKLVCAAVWELVKEKSKLTEDDLVAKVAELDAKDGWRTGSLPAGCQVRAVPADGAGEAEQVHVLRHGAAGGERV